MKRGKPGFGLIPLATMLCTTAVEADRVGDAVEYRQGIVNLYAHIINQWEACSRERPNSTLLPLHTPPGSLL